jgi:methylenetetrahydrofolate--tRNA-(uracil-5-)-methyltransferase
MAGADVTVIGAGLAGSEAAWQLARRGWRVALWEMRPAVMTPVHRTGRFAELVCSNSLKSENPASAPFLLKEELRHLGSLLLAAAESCRVPAGQALAVDRERFAERVEAAVRGTPGVTVVEAEARAIPDGRPAIIATGPLTAPELAEAVRALAGAEHLYFYDAISPIVAGESVDRTVAFAASRYGKGGDDYLNCPLNREEYRSFLEALRAADIHPQHDFESATYFEGCLPIEEIVRRGEDTLRFGPMKPVGLVDPRTGVMPYAALQLRRETLLGDAFNLVGFQTRLRFGEQRRVFRMIPGLAEAEFVRFGQIHRNTYLNAPAALTPILEFQAAPGVFVAGQLCGLEGYVEAVATGLLAALQADRRLRGRPPVEFPRDTALGSLQHALGAADPRGYQPLNITFALLPPPPPEVARRLHGKADRHAWRVRESLRSLREFAAREGLAPQ